MKKMRDKEYWSPYLAGAFAGLVLVLSVWITGKYFGASTSFVRSAGLIEKIFSAERVGLDIEKMKNVLHYINNMTIIVMRYDN